MKPLDIAGSALVRVRGDDQTYLALWRDERLCDLRPLTLDALLQFPLQEMRAGLNSIAGAEIDPARVELAAPVESQEVWAAGVTYLRGASATRGNGPADDLRARLRERSPGVFFKAAGCGSSGRRRGRRARGFHVGCPEPELAVLSNSRGEVVAYACGNDELADIEGEKPLFLPQAKIYDRSCAIGPAAVLAWGIDMSRADIRMTIERGGESVFDGTATLADMTRDPAKLAAVLHSSYTLPVGAWLLTGTSLVPPQPYTARPGDLVRIRIYGLASL